MKLTNQKIKQILEKMVNPTCKDWSLRLIDGLWMYRIAYKTPLGMFQYRLVYGKTCYLLVELEYKTYLAPKTINLDLKTVGSLHKLKLNKLDELRCETYENTHLEGKDESDA